MSSPGRGRGRGYEAGQQNPRSWVNVTQSQNQLHPEQQAQGVGQLGEQPRDGRYILGPPPRPAPPPQMYGQQFHIPGNFVNSNPLPPQGYGAQPPGQNLAQQQQLGIPSQSFPNQGFWGPDGVWHSNEPPQVQLIRTNPGAYDMSQVMFGSVPLQQQPAWGHPSQATGRGSPHLQQHTPGSTPQAGSSQSSRAPSPSPRSGLRPEARAFVPEGMRRQQVVEPPSEDAPGDMRQEQPGSRSAKFGEQERLDPSTQTPYSGQVDLAAEYGPDSEESWLRFVSHRCQNVLRVSRENSAESTDQLLRIAADLSTYRYSHRLRDAILPTRPAERTTHPRYNGPGEIVANHFRLHMRQEEDSEDRVPFNMYTISWAFESSKKSPQKAQTLRLWEQLWKRHGNDVDKFNGIVPAYDGGGALVSPKAYPFGDQIELQVNDKCKATIKWSETIDDDHILKKFLNKTSDGVFPKKLVLALNLITKQFCINNKYIDSGRFYFAPEFRDTAFTRDVLDSMPGYFQSVRALQAGLMINVDVMNTAFYKSGVPLFNLWEKMIYSKILPESKANLFQDFHRRLKLNAEQVGVIREYWKNLQIKSSHRKLLLVDNEPKIFSVFDVSDENAETQKVAGHYEVHGDVSTVELLKGAYRYEDGPVLDGLLGKLPAIKVSKTLDYYLPWGCCQTTDGSRYGGKLDDRRLLEKLARPAAERYESIATWMENRHSNTNSNLAPNPDAAERSFGIDIEHHMVSVTAFSLRRPTMIGYKKGERLPKPADISGWGLVYATEDVDRNYWESILRALTTEAATRGMRWPEKLPQLTVVNPAGASNDEKRENMRQSVKKLMDDYCKLKRNPSAKLSLVICLMKRKMTPEYSTFKYMCDKTHGVPSQVVIIPDNKKNISTTISNLLLKINVKCGGANFEFAQETRTVMTLLDGSTMLLGADVTHPPGGDPAVPSIAAVVATTDEGGIDYACRIQAQTSKQEAIEGLDAMVGELLEVYKNSSKARAYPNKILFFRDGVSETQFLTTLRKEGVAILNAAKLRLQDGKEYKPKLFIILAVKRHRTRFFKAVPMARPEQKEKYPAAADVNIPAGTLVQDMVTHPREFDFYLCSQDPGKGTSRATHYHVLLDQINVGRDELYTLVYNLCYAYQRCTKSVSLVTPVYYAHLAAFRAKQYMEYYVADRRYQVKRAARSPVGVVIPGQPIQADFNAHEDLRNKLWFL